MGHGGSPTLPATWPGLKDQIVRAYRMGAFARSVDAAYTSGFATEYGRCPRSTATAASAVLRLRSITDWSEYQPACGDRMTFGRDSNGESAGTGSCSRTSRPAPPIRPSLSARQTASVSTTPPRAVLTRRAVGF